MEEKKEVERAGGEPFRRIREHEINGFNREHVQVLALDGPGPGGASHRYNVLLAQNGIEVVGAEFKFQNGPVKEAGVNGVTDEALLAILIDRLQGFQSEKYSCHENALALTHMQDAMHWLQHRMQARERRGVEGTSQV